MSLGTKLKDSNFSSKMLEKMLLVLLKDCPEHSNEELALYN